MLRPIFFTPRSGLFSAPSFLTSSMADSRDWVVTTVRSAGSSIRLPTLFRSASHPHSGFVGSASRGPLTPAGPARLSSSPPPPLRSPPLPIPLHPYPHHQPPPTTTQPI